MKEDEEVILMRKFGYCYIRWRISEFCFETPIEDLLISTPEFCVDGIYVTKWKMTLNPKMMHNGEEHFSVSLERLKSDSGPESVSVSFKIWILENNGEECSNVTYSNKFKTNYPHVITLESARFIRKKMMPLPYDVVRTFKISCRLIVNFEDCYDNIDGPADTGLKSLSDDLTNLYEAGTDYDIILRFNNKDIYAHKAVLCSRSPFLEYMLKTKCKENVLDLSRLNYEAMKNLVAYVYSGNVNYIGRNASVSVFETSMALELDYIELYFSPNYLDINSTIDVRKHSFTWVIKDYQDITDDCILSPLFTTEYMDATWRLYLYRRGVNHTDKCLSLFADVVEGTKPENACFGFALTDHRENLWWQRMQLLNDSNERLGFEKFISEDHFKLELEKSACNTLHVVFKLAIHSDAVYSSEFYTSSNGELPKSYFYKHLSSELTSKLLEQGAYADVVLEAEGSFFKAPKCILSARSPVLKSMLNQISDEKSVVLDMKSNVLQTILRYIYSGDCGDVAKEEILDLYKAADHLSLTDLKEKLSSVLQEY